MLVLCIVINGNVNCVTFYVNVFFEIEFNSQIVTVTGINLIMLLLTDISRDIDFQTLCVHRTRRITLHSLFWNLEHSNSVEYFKMQSPNFVKIYGCHHLILCFVLIWITIIDLVSIVLIFDEL